MRVASSVPNPFIALRSASASRVTSFLAFKPGVYPTEGGAGWPGAGAP